MEISEQRRREVQAFARIKRTSAEAYAIGTVIDYQRPEERSVQVLLTMHTVIGALALALAADQLPLEVDVLASITTVISGTWMTARFALKTVCTECVKELKKQHPARVRLILHDIRERVSHLTFLVNEVERKFFPEEK